METRADRGRARPIDALSRQQPLGVCCSSPSRRARRVTARRRNGLAADVALYEWLARDEQSPVWIDREVAVRCATVRSWVSADDVISGRKYRFALAHAARATLSAPRPKFGRAASYVRALPSEADPKAVSERRIRVRGIVASGKGRPAARID